MRGSRELLRNDIFEAGIIPAHAGLTSTLYAPQM